MTSEWLLISESLISVAADLRVPALPSEWLEVMVMAVMVAVILSDGGRDPRPTLDKILYRYNIVGILGDFRGSLGFWGFFEDSI